jgi:predicted nucleic-acid-binding Zn-ribbon protein
MAEKDPQEYEINGKSLECLVCGNRNFRQRLAQLNTAGATFLGLDWANQSAHCFVCAECGYIHWFLLNAES